MTAKCACRKVDYMPIRNKDGTYTEQWMCLDCKSIFVRKAATPQPDACTQLSDVRALIKCMFLADTDDFGMTEARRLQKAEIEGYNKGIAAVLKKISEHFA